ncbi:MAG: methyltransferase domain-containing protein [Bacteroidota bacterium]
MSQPEPDPFPPLMELGALEWTDVVANCTMNRARRLEGGNGYGRELGRAPLDLVRATLERRQSAAWLDLCCGQGRALIEAARVLEEAGQRADVVLHGVDLVDMFAPTSGPSPPQFFVASLHAWEAPRSYDLITCVHGFHYIGDKLDLLARVSRWLTPEGTLLAHLDLDSIHIEIEGEPARAWLRTALKRHGFAYYPQRRLVRRDGPAVIDWGLDFLGADPKAGPNYTGQPAVDAYYRRSELA